ncbi:CaiB/BaiF CoA transferase family protein [Achromobacter sp.]|uniref:CaiB/BaiF CoA transferase family protein n=1 Tax=Achromobacter sp. TaxID=134375 RepID=UPI003C735514
MHTSNASNQAALEGLTVLDLAGPLGNYCGKLYADMGAEVILVEPLAGARTRWTGPYAAGRQGQPDASLTFQYQNTGKRSIAIDLDSSAGQAVFRSLAGVSNLIIESEQPGTMQRRGLDHASLTRVRTDLVMTSITAFGQEGPYAHWQATDLTAMAMGGMLYLAGYPDTAPMVACGEQAVGAANLFAAVASMAALHDTENGGTGQHIDVSMQECVVLGMENAVQFYDLEGTVRKRNAGTQRLAGTGAFACADGYVYMMAGGIGSNRFWSVTTEWLIGEGVAGAEQFREPRWTDQGFLATDEAKSIFGQVFTPYVRTRTKAQLEQMGREHRIPIAPICDASDIAGNVQREYRNYFVDVTSIDGTRLRMPGAPYLLSETPWRLYRRAPGLGEHTREILSRAGIDAIEQEQLFAQGVVQ